LSKSIIFIKEKYKQQYDENKKELNFLLIDPLIKRALVLIFIKTIENFRKYNERKIREGGYRSIN
jgi:hypothetical protein